MPTALSAYFASVPIVPALTVAAIAIGLVVRVSLLTSPKTYSLWRSILKSPHHKPSE